jgi:hypothetical protein
MGGSAKNPGTCGLPAGNGTNLRWTREPDERKFKQLENRSVLKKISQFRRASGSPLLDLHGVPGYILL